MEKIYIVDVIGITGLGKKIHKAGESVTKAHFPKGRFEQLKGDGFLREPTKKELKTASDIIEADKAKIEEEKKVHKEKLEKEKEQDDARVKAKAEAEAKDKSKAEAEAKDKS